MKNKYKIEFGHIKILILKDFFILMEVYETNDLYSSLKSWIKDQY